MKKNKMICPVCGSKKEMIIKSGKDKMLACYDCGSEKGLLTKHLYKILKEKEVLEL